MQICKYSDSLCSVACVKSDITNEGPRALALLNSPQVDIITAWFRYVKLFACWVILPAYSHLLLLFLKKKITGIPSVWIKIRLDGFALTVCRGYQ